MSGLETSLSAAGARLERSFFDRDPCTVARELIGCTLSRDGVAGRIVETEAYHESEPACHAYAGLTARTRVLFGPPGRSYVYLSYGIHQLFNVVTCRQEEGAAVLIRALEPLSGLEEMSARRPGRSRHELCSGPGKLTLALGIGADDNDTDLIRGPIALAEPRDLGGGPRVRLGRRVGISKATELPWRFWAADAGPYLSIPAGR